MATYIVPYAYEYDAHSCLTSEAKARCDTATRVAATFQDATVILTAGVPKRYQSRPGIVSLAFSMMHYLVERGVSKYRIFCFPHGYNTVTETIAALSLVGRGADDMVIAVTSWYHVPRVWMIWFLLSGRMVRIAASRKTDYVLGAVCHELLGIPFSFLESLLYRLRRQ